MAERTHMGAMDIRTYDRTEGAPNKLIVQPVSMVHLTMGHLGMDDAYTEVGRMKLLPAEARIIAAALIGAADDIDPPTARRH